MTKYVALLLLALAATLPAAAAAKGAECTLPANKPAAPGQALKKPITLKPETPTEVVNFDGGRGTKSFEVVLLASSVLPKQVKPNQFEIDTPKRFRRVSDELESASLAMPTFSPPRFIDHRHAIQFLACVDTGKAEAGQYIGQILVSGPRGLTGTSVTVTVNTKDETRFVLGLIVALLAAVALLLLQGAKKKRDEEKGADGKPTLKWGEAVKQTAAEFGFWISTAIAIVGAFVATMLIYAKDPAWGADLWQSFFALCGAVFGATGVGSLINTSARGA